jgi:hypothetical protein
MKACMVKVSCSSEFRKVPKSQKYGKQEIPRDITGINVFQKILKYMVKTLIMMQICDFIHRKYTRKFKDTSLTYQHPQA